MRTFLKLFGLLLILTVGAAAVLLATFDLDAWLSEQAARMAPEISKRIGREVKIGAVKGSLYPLFGGVLSDLSVAGAKPGEPHLLAVDRLVVEARVWPAIRSLGRSIEVNKLVAKGARLQLRRYEDGSNNWEEPLVEALTSGATEEKKPESDVAPLFERIAVEDALVELKDVAAPADAQLPTISKLLIETVGYRMGGPLELRIAAAVGAADRNLEARLGIPALKKIQTGAAPPLEWAELKCEQIDLDAFAKWASAPLPAGSKLGKLSADLKTADPFGALGRTRVDGFAALKGARTPDADGGEVFDASLKTGFVWSMMAGSLDLGESELKLADMALVAKGKVQNIWVAPSFEGLEARTEKLDLGKLRRIAPWIFASLPKGAILSGPAELNVLAKGDAKSQQVSLVANLDGSRVFFPGALDKPAGAPLRLDAEATLLGDSAELKSVKAALGELVFEGSGKVSSFASGSFSVRGGTGRFELSRLSRLLPAVEGAMAGTERASGVMEIDGSFSRSPEKIDGKALVSFAGANLAVDGAALKGSGRVQVKAAGKPGSNLTVDLDAALTGMDLRFGEAMRKPAGVPFEVGTKLRLSAAKSSAKPLKLRIGPLKLDGEATWSSKTGRARIQATVPPFSVAELGKVLPAFASEGLPAMKLGFTATLEGPMADISSSSLTLTGLDVAVAGQTLNGQAELKTLMPPVGKANLSAQNLDIDRLLDALGGEKKERKGPILPPSMREADLAFEALAGSGTYLGEAFNNLGVKATLRKGWLSFESLDLQAFDGGFTLGGTRANLTVEPLRFELKGAVKKVDAARFLLQRAGLPAPVRGKLSAGIEAKGAGLDWKSAARGLSGEVELSLADAMLPGLSLERSVLGQAAKLVPGFEIPGGAGPTSLGSISAKFRVDGGQMRLKAPLTAATSAGELGLDGAVGLDGSLRLVGSLAVPPAVVASFSGGRIKPPAPVPIGLLIGGDLWAPKISGVDGSALAAMALSESMKALGVDKVKKAAEDKVQSAKKAAKKKVTELKKRAEDEAQRVKREAEARATELRRKVEEEARKRREEAEKRARELEEKARQEAKKLEEKAKKKAKKALGDLFKGR
jgi:uncharacterized protein involved in outer membrane biogenesis